MIVLDSNIWIAYFYESDSQHTKAVKIFKDISQSIILPEYVIVEVTTVLAQRAGKDAVNSFLDLVENNRDVHILITEEDFFLEIVKEFRSMHIKKLSFVDTSLYVLSQEYALITFDKALLRATKVVKKTR